MFCGRFGATVFVPHSLQLLIGQKPDKKKEVTDEDKAQADALKTKGKVHHTCML